MYHISILVLFIIATSCTYALNYGDMCDPVLKYTKSGAYDDDCDNVYLYCDSASHICKYKGCSNSDYISGWDIKVREFPARCTNTTYCPDNGSACTPTVPIGSHCELLRDDECQGTTSICLNSTCFVKAAPLGGNCGSESTTFTSYLAGGEEFLQTTVRDNCTTGTYCDNSFLCITSKELGLSCEQDRECLSGSCSNAGICVNGPDVFHKIQPWTWGVVGTAIVIFIALVLVSLWFLHRYQSKKEHAKIVKFFGDNEEFSKYAMLQEDDDNHSMYMDNQSYNSGSNRPSVVYLTTPDYMTSQSLTLKNRNSSSSLNLATNNSNQSPQQMSSTNLHTQ